MAKDAYLLLEDGSIYRGEAFGAETFGSGEVVFNTSMTGYQEVLTDPSYAGQIVLLTYPLVGNYGINEKDFESKQIQVTGFVVRGHCDYPSHALSTSTLHEFLVSQGIPGIKGVDTRSITRRLGSRGVMMGMIGPGKPDGRSEASSGGSLTTKGQAKHQIDGLPPLNATLPYLSEETAEAALAQLRGSPQYGDVDYVKKVTTAQPYCWEEPPEVRRSEHRIIVVDFGLKYNILRMLRSRGCEVMAVPAATSLEDMLSLKPAGVVLSPGPGDPALLEYIVENVRTFIKHVPIMGICLGHQIVARALGANTYKLKFGHRGANHPVKDLSTGRVYITAQNHGYAVGSDGLPSGLEVTHINLNDSTVEGMRHRELPIMTIQYHSEASPGPRDSEYLFDRFLEMVGEA